ncbi:CheR family methyltransferase [Baaleninema sp.]|uniref:CheR family methyltransferase n=1 Tax=Baaleninema sp. TaxID=3101197 RepID=UPI003D07FD67
MDNIPTETSFFRDLQVFEALRQSIFPELLRRHRLDRQLNLWSAACSSGQEAYSLAILLRDYFPLLAQNWTLNFLASDVSETMLAKARSGIYDDLEVHRRLPPKFLRRYFHQEGSQWVVSDEIRLMVQFQQIDLLQPLPPLPTMDVIFLRNLLIYFDRPTQAEILNKMRQVLAPDGYLLLGATETPLRCDTRFKPVAVDRAVFFQIRPPDDAAGGRSRHTGS